MAKKGDLKTYQKKRDFSRTPEPAGEAKGRHSKRPDSQGRVYVIQKHDASRLHYDFRIEVDGVLKSWAVPKGPSMNPNDKRLAVLVEDHPLDYATFEGIIPEGYGAGTVMVWDTGSYYNLKLNADGTEVSMAETFEDGRVEIWLEGKKLRGGFALVKTRLAGKQEQWLLIKMKDALAENKGDVTVDKPDSAATGKRLEEIAQNE
jgi:bifunctional non-homologous end joining protein LigD